MIRAVLLLLAFAFQNAAEAALNGCSPDHDGYCWCSTSGSDWCWVNTDGKDGYYNEKPSNHYSCSTWEGYSPDTYCRNAASSSSSSGADSTSSSSGDDSNSGSAPSGNYNVEVDDKYSGGGFSQADVQKMLDLHNKMRCVAGSPPIKWSGAIEKQAQDTQNRIGAFSHSDCYSLPISVGENLATGSSVDMASWMWFTEVLQTTDYSSGETGHYTAMVWKGVTEMGCGIGDKVIRCQYKGNPAPNMQGDYGENAPLFKGTTADFERCKLSVDDLKTNAKKYQGWGILNINNGIWNKIGLYTATDGIVLGDDDWTVNMSVLIGCTFGGVAAMGAVFFAVRLGRRGVSSMFPGSSGSTATEEERELLNVESIDA